MYNYTKCPTYDGLTIFLRGNIDIMDYKGIALQLFNELSDIYVTDIDKRADLYKRYPSLSKEFLQRTENSIKDYKILDDYNVEEATFQQKRSYT